MEACKSHPFGGLPICPRCGALDGRQKASQWKCERCGWKGSPSKESKPEARSRAGFCCQECGAWEHLKRDNHVTRREGS